MSCGVGHRRGSDLALLWLWQRLAATAPIRPLAWELPYAKNVALERKEGKERKKNEAKIVGTDLMKQNIVCQAKELVVYPKMQISSKDFH